MIVNLNLKRTALLSCLFFGTFAANAQRIDFTLTVKPEKPLPGYKAFLFYKKGPGSTTIDSAAYADGKFELKGNVSFAQRAVVYVQPANTNFGHGMNTIPGMSVYLENGNVVLSGKLAYETAKRGGTPLNNDFQAYIDAVSPFSKKEAEFLVKNKTAISKNDTVAINRLESEYYLMAKAKRKVEDEYFNQHLGSLVSFEWLKKTINVQQEKTKGIVMFDKLSDALKNSHDGQIYSNLIHGTKAVEVGKIAPDFTAKNLDGQDISLSSYKGKYVLVDFWASWCVPCRRENPNVLKAYNAYKHKGFNVLAFSLDDKKENWAKAVTQDGLPWMQVSDLGAFYSPVVGAYGIKSIPSNFLINPEGVIIAMDLRGNDLEKALAKVWGNTAAAK